MYTSNVRMLPTVGGDKNNGKTEASWTVYISVNHAKSDAEVAWLTYAHGRRPILPSRGSANL